MKRSKRESSPAGGEAVVWFRCIVQIQKGLSNQKFQLWLIFFFNHLPMDIYVMNHTFYKVIIDNLRNVRIYLLKAMLHFLQRIWGKSPCTL